MEITSASYTAHAKAILFGEHSIVYGGSAIVVPVPQLRVTATATFNGGTPAEFVMSQRRVGLEELARFYPGVYTALSHFPCPEGYSISLSTESNIPTSRGLGSSAAVAQAVTNALHNMFRNAECLCDSKLANPVSRSQIFTIVRACEDAVHGSASGLDQCGVCSSVTRFFHRASRQEFSVADERTFDSLVLAETLGLPLPSLGLSLVIADTGKDKNTKDAIVKVRQRLDRNDQVAVAAMTALSHLAEEARKIWLREEARRIGALMDEAQTHLASLGLSTPELDQLIDSMHSTGALGAKLSGGGCGGIAIGLYSDEQMAEKAIAQLKILGRDAWRVDL